MTDVAPRYQTVKQHILDRIAVGDWPPGARIPSENELVAALGISRMTINRAVRELAQEGLVVRLGGVGTFVAEPRSAPQAIAIPPIEQWIAARGHRHSWRVIETSRFEARPELARLYGLKPGTRLAFALILHAESNRPIQLEERHVNLEAVPSYADADLQTALPDDILVQAIPTATVRLTIEAVPPSRRTADLLEMTPQDACLLISKRIEAGGSVASIARLFHPGSRFRLDG
jgi:GntR family histidine utilization transcriptional repressor